MFSRFLIGLALVAGCNTEPANDHIQLSWGAADTFHVAARYKALNPKSEESAVDLEGATERTPFDEAWSEEAVWTYQVVETGLLPSEGDELHPYSVRDGDEPARLTVVRAWLDASLNDDPNLLNADPVVYMVFREDRDRLAAIISFTNEVGEDGATERVERAFSTEQLGRSYSVLSQTMLTAAPTLLAPFSAGFRNETKVLENGSELHTELRGEGAVDVVYEDELGGGLIASTYELGAPWPVRTISDTIDARLLSDDEVDARRLPLLPDPPENYDYRAALRSRVNLDNALKLDPDTLDGGWSGGAPEGYRPWAGSWWPLQDGELVFGYDGRPTYSQLLKPIIEPTKRDLDRLSEELRNLDRSSSEYATKSQEYKTKQEELTTKLVAFYNGMLSAVNGGHARIEGGKLIHDARGTAGTDEVANIFTRSWSYDLDRLSPFDKFALQQWADGKTNPNPFFGPAWEILNQWNPGGGSWWGHCNAWAAAAILTDEPRTELSSTLKSQSVKWTTADQKGLITEVHYSVNSSFYGQRYNGEEQDISDLSPKNFHQIIQFYLRDQQVPLVFDTSADEPVWNYPAYWADVTVRETTPGAGGTLVNVNTATSAELQTVSGIGPSLASAIIKYREANGPFQSLDELVNVSGIGNSSLNNMRPYITVDPASNERTFDVTAGVRFTTDGVSETHVDSDVNEPQGFTNTYRYTLTTDKDGRVMKGAWANDREHPDFAWVPYFNDLGPASGGSENPYIAYRDVIRVIGDTRRE